MSRIGSNPIIIPDDVSVDIQGQTVTVKGPKGELSRDVHQLVDVALEESENGRQIRLQPRNNKDKKSVSLWPTWRTQIHNMVVGVHEGFTKRLEVQGVGYRAQVQGSELVLGLGYSHEIRYPVPEEIQVEVDKQNVISISGIDKELVGQVAAEIYAKRPPEPYKGKGVRYQGEYILRKEGKKK